MHDAINILAHKEITFTNNLWRLDGIGQAVTTSDVSSEQPGVLSMNFYLK